MSNKTFSKKQNKRGDEYSTNSSVSNHMIQEGRGILSKIFGSDAGSYATKLVLDSFESKGALISLFVIKHARENDVDLDFNERDSEGRTILHWLVSLSGKIPFAKKLLFDVLNTPGISKHLNNQDKAGNTIAHIALYISEFNDVDMDDVITALIRKGVDLSLKNSEGLRVLLSGVPEKKSEDSEKSEIHNYTINNIFMKKPSQKEEINEFNEFNLSDTEAAKIAENLVKRFVMRTNGEENKDYVNSETINFSRNTETENESVRESVQKKKKNENAKSLSDFDKLLNTKNITNITNKNSSDAKKNSSQKDKVSVSFGGNKNDSENSLEIIKDLVSNFKRPNSLDNVTDKFQLIDKMQLGGGNKITGIRRKISYSERSEISEQSSSDKKRMGVLEKQLAKYKIQNNATSSDMDVSMSSSYNFHKKGGANESNIEKEYDSSDDSSSTSTSDESSAESSAESSTESSTESSSTDSAYIYSGGSSEYEDMEQDSNVNNDKESEGLDKLSRVKNEDNEHSRAVKKIMEIMKVDEENAKIYKSILWEKINDEMKGELNKPRSEELEKRASDEKLLKKITSKEFEAKKKEIEKKQKERENNKKDLSRFIQTLSDDVETSMSDESEESD